MLYDVAWNWIKANWKKEDGQAMAEYGLILALIAVVVIGAVTLIGTNLNTKFNAVVDAIKP
jgi:pilus assembly protein Flp/PilA